MSWVMTSSFPIATRLAQYLRDENGAVTVDYVFMTAAVVGAAFATITALSGGLEDISNEIVSELTDSELIFMTQNFGRDRRTVLMEGTREFFSANAMGSRYDIWSDPERKTDTQVRNAHRTWSRRMADPAYSQPARAADLVRILEFSLDARHLEPHDNI